MAVNSRWHTAIAAVALFVLSACGTNPTVQPSDHSPKTTTVPNGWLSWRGPNQNGTSLETNLPSKWELNGANHLWTLDLKGRGTPVINGNRVYAWGYVGEKSELYEVLVCLDADSGKELWRHDFSDFISDIIYDRYTIGAPTIDPQTGNVFLMSTAGELTAFTPDGKVIWQQSMVESFGRGTYPNGRTGAVAIEGDLAIVHVISSNWGGQGPPRDRFYAFDKKDGKIVWASTPGVGPPFLKDSCFATPVFVWKNGRRVFYSGTGCGNVVCVDARTGIPIWRMQQSFGGVNSSVLYYKGKVIVTHGRANLDSTKIGRMNALKSDLPADTSKQTVYKLKDREVWRNEHISMFTSSPVLVGDRVYQISETGVLHCVDVNTGKDLWDMKLGTAQIHASPLYGDGKLYCPMNDGSFYILKLRDDGADVLSKVKLEGNCLGAPAAWNGKIYVFTNRKFYCFGKKGDNKGHTPAPPKPLLPTRGGKVAKLQVIPNEVLLEPGEKASFRVRAIDANGNVVGPVKNVKWEKYVPPTAKVKAKLDADFNDKGELVAGSEAKTSAGAFRAVAQELPGPPADPSKPVLGIIRGRVITPMPFKQDFESFDVSVDHATEGVKFAYPPLPWIGGRFKWEIREHAGSKVLAKTTDRLILQRAITFLGRADSSNYTLQADVFSDGTRRGMGEVGLINQRYQFVLKGNHQVLEVSSNQERFVHNVKFAWKRKTWYTLKTRIDIGKDGVGMIRAKAWPRGEKEPDAWTLEVKHNRPHRQGAPGLFGFSPQQVFRVYVDNITATKNDK